MFWGLGFRVWGMWFGVWGLGASFLGASEISFSFAAFFGAS